MPTQPLGISNVGEVVGAYADAAGGVHGFPGSPGRRVHHDRRSPTPWSPLYSNINDKGQDGRRLHRQRRKVRGFRRERSGENTTIDAPGAVQTRVRPINNRGQIAIDTVDAQLVHHFLLDRGRFTEIRRRGASATGRSPPTSTTAAACWAGLGPLKRRGEVGDLGPGKAAVLVATGGAGRGRSGARRSDGDRRTAGRRALLGSTRRVSRRWP
jgi:hypothetical protein